MAIKTTLQCDECTRELDQAEDKIVSVSVMVVEPGMVAGQRVYHWHDKCFARSRWPEVELPAPQEVPVPPGPEPPAPLPDPPGPATVEPESEEGE